MRQFFLLIIVLAVCACKQKQKDTIPKIIFDTDIGGDIDDLGALYALHVYADQGLCNIVAVMSSWSMKYHVNGIDAVNTYFGRPDIPIGVYEDKFFEEDDYTWFVGEKFSNDINAVTAPKATILYRELLSKSTDTSITIVVTGRLNNIAKLLKSKPDTYSHLHGSDLIQKKVKAMYVMGGFYDGQSQVESNFKWGGKGVTKYVVDNFSRPMIFNGGEIGEAKQGYSTGDRINQLSDDHILKSGYQYFFQNPPKWTKMKPSDTIKEWSIWDIITVQVAVTGIEDYFDIVEKGHNSVDSLGYNSWKNTPDKDHSYLKQKMDPKLYADSVIETLFMQEANARKKKNQ